MNKKQHIRRITRRRFLQSTAAAGLGAAGLLAPRGVSAKTAPGSFSFGLVTDVHHADKPAGGKRHYRDSLDKLGLAVQTFNRQQVSFVAELGDFVDAAPAKAQEMEYLKTADKVYQGFPGNRYYVLGNHCLAAFSKDEFLAGCSAGIKRSYYSFDEGPFHFVVLDANFKQDGSPYDAGNYTWTDTWIHEPQQKWLARDLEQARGRKTFVFIHQNLHNETDAHGVKNAPEVRRLLEAAGNVLAVFQGHMHSGGYAKIAGIPYCTLKATVEGPGLENHAYGIVVVDPSERVTLEGFGRQEDVAVT